jgi:branched-chain amino acid transport system substrate-binding protein
MMMIRSLAILNALLFALQFGLGSRPARSADASTTIPVILSLTGGAAFLGKEEAEALQLLERSENKAAGATGRQVHFDIQDDESNPQVAVQLTNRLIAQGVPVILGSDTAASCAAMAPLLQNGPVLYCFSPAIQSAPGSYIFSAGVSADDITVAILRFAKRSGIQQIASLLSNDASGQVAQQSLVHAMQLSDSSSLKVLSTDYFNPADLTVTAQISKIKQEKAQACFCFVTGAAFGTVLRSYAEAGLTIPVMTSSGNMLQSQLAQYESLDLSTLYFVGFQYFQRDKLPKDINTAVSALYRAYDAADLKPDVAAGLVWDPARLVLAAYRQLPPKFSADQMRNFLAHVRGFPGINGTYDFVARPQRGLGDEAAVMARWVPAKRSWVAVKSVKR